MPPLEYADHYQDIVYWEAVGTDSYGKAVVRNPIGLKARWEPSYVEMVNSDGSRTTADIVVHCRQDFVLGSIVWYGRVSDLPEDTANLNTLYEVLFKEETVDLKNRFTNRVAYLKRFRDSLPTVQS